MRKWIKAKVSGIRSYFKAKKYAREREEIVDETLLRAKKSVMMAIEQYDASTPDLPHLKAIVKKQAAGDKLKIEEIEELKKGQRNMEFIIGKLDKSIEDTNYLIGEMRKNPNKKANELANKMMINVAVIGIVKQEGKETIAILNAAIKLAESKGKK